MTMLAALVAFNLVCAGSMSTETTAGTETKPYESTYRVDLTRKLWCDGECKERFPIAVVRATTLVLQDESTDTPSEKSTMSVIVNRETGEHFVAASHKTYGRFGINFRVRYDGQCEKRAFSGFPSAKTKF